MTAPTIQQLFGLALQHHQAGRLQDAERFYRQILTQQPGHADALHYLGMIAARLGRPDVAVDLIHQAIGLRPDNPEAHNSLGNALSDQGHLDEAIAAYRRAIALEPNYPDAHNNLGTALKDQGHLDEAIAACRQAITLKPDYPEAHYNLGNALRDSGHVDEAIAAYRQAILLNPNFPQAHSNLGSALSDQGQLDEAIAAFRRAIAINPILPEAGANLANALRDKGKLEEAIAVCRRVISQKPGYPEAYNSLGNSLNDCGRVDEAIAAFRQAIALKPNFPEAHSNLGNALKDTGQLDEAIASFRQALALRPSYPRAHSNLVLCMHYHPGHDAQAIYEENLRWNERHAEPLRKFIRPHAKDRDPDRRLRIGYVSPDFRDHVVGRFLLPLLEQHDRQQVEIFCYANVRGPDAWTERFRARSDHWHNILGLTDEQAAKLIRDHQIDILIDLSGHTADNRLLIFARRPAPVQVTYLGYPNTTGLSAMDYRLTDAYADPLGKTECYHSEQLIRLSPCAWCYSPALSPPVAQRRAGPITFGSFNASAKITNPMLRLWARILHAAPESRLLLKAPKLGSQFARRRFQQLLVNEGIGAERLELRGFEPGYAQHLALYGNMDIALDTFPYHGTTTTCEALWMGVPVVSLAGKSHVSRVAVSLLSNVGLPELVAGSDEQYLQIAVRLANDPARLAQLRSTLRHRMRQSPLMDAPSFARNIESAYRQMWRKWCAITPPEA